MPFRIDFHVHTYYSYDSVNRPRNIIKRASKLGLDAVVVVDHETIKGGQETARLESEDILIIPSVEINTDIGDIVGLWVNREIETREYHAVIEAIHDQGGIATLPHPYHKHNLPEDICEHVDLIEINNARAMASRNKLAHELAESHAIPTCSGSDAHFCWEIGNAYTEFEDTPGSRDELKEIILHGKRIEHINYSNPIGIILGQAIKYWRRPDMLLKRLEKLGGKKA